MLSPQRNVLSYYLDKEAEGDNFSIFPLLSFVYIPYISTFHIPPLFPISTSASPLFQANSKYNFRDQVFFSSSKPQSFFSSLFKTLPWSWPSLPPRDLGQWCWVYLRRKPRIFHKASILVFYRAAPHEHTPGCQTRLHNGLKCPEEAGVEEAVRGGWEGK